MIVAREPSTIRSIGCPMGSSPAKKSRASASLMTATGARSATSSAVYVRPRTARNPSVAKYSARVSL